MDQNILTIKNLSISFQEEVTARKATNGIYLKVAKGEILAIVGESGSGKSVTSLSVLQLLPSPPAKYQQGEILYNFDGSEKDLLKLKFDAIQKIRGNKIAMIFQEPMSSLNPVITCGKQVAEAIQSHQSLSPNQVTEKVITLFEQVQLPNPKEIYHKYPHQLSGGQKQRVMIAIAMSNQPELLICDEPTTALDVTVQKNVLALIKSLQMKHQMAVIFISHDLGVVAEIADSVGVMYKGELIELASTKEIFENPKHSYTKALLACRPILHKKGDRLPIISDFLPHKSLDILNQPVDQNVALKDMDQVVATELRQPLIIIKDLSVHFPISPNLVGKSSNMMKAVDRVSFEIMEGETLGLVGESGSGKTSLGRAILQLVKAQSGTIQYKGIDLINADPTQMKLLRKEMQIIFQDPYASLNPRMTIGEAIAEPLLVHGIGKDEKERKELVIRMLEKVDLAANHFHRYPHEFSGGQRQRVVIARALALNPSFVICDESVSALDVSVQAQVLNLLNKLKKEMGFTALFISHDLAVVKYISDRMMVLNKGKIVEMGLSEQIYQHPQHPYTQSLIASVPRGIVPN